MYSYTCPAMMCYHYYVIKKHFNYLNYFLQVVKSDNNNNINKSTLFQTMVCIIWSKKNNIIQIKAMVENKGTIDQQYVVHD